MVLIFAFPRNLILILWGTFIIVIIIIFLILDFYYNCRFNARSYFERALVLLDDNVGK